MLTEDDLDDIVISAAGDGRHRQAAARFEELAGRPELHGEVSAATLLVNAGGQFGLADDWDEAVRCYRAAIAAGGGTDFDPRVWLHDALIHKGDAAQAAAVRAEIKAARSTIPDVYGIVAESLASSSDPQEAHLWFTMGYHRCLDAPVPDYELSLLLVGRRNIRAELGYPMDGLDAIAEDYVNSDS